MIAVNHSEADHFTQADADVVDRFAKAFSLGYARYLDFRQLEAQNRELEIERALGSVQNAVQAMKSSADIVRIIVLLSQELENLGLDFAASIISLIDETEGKARSYMMSVVDARAFWEASTGILPFREDTIARLEHEEGPIAISDLPGAKGLWNKIILFRHVVF